MRLSGREFIIGTAVAARRGVYSTRRTSNVCEARFRFQKGGLPRRVWGVRGLRLVRGWMLQIAQKLLRAFGRGFRNTKLAHSCTGTQPLSLFSHGRSPSRRRRRGVGRCVYGCIKAQTAPVVVVEPIEGCGFVSINRQAFRHAQWNEIERNLFN